MSEPIGAEALHEGSFADYGLNIASEAITVATQPVDPLAAAEEQLAVYKALELVADEGKAREMFGQALAGLSENLPESVTTKPHDLIMVPKLGSLSLSGLVEKFNGLSTKEHPFDETYICKALWDQYSCDELNQGQTADLSPQAILLEANNDFDEPGLYFTGQNLTTQRNNLKAAQETYAKESSTTRLHSQGVASYIIRQGTKQVRGEQPVDFSTFTRFVELDNKTADGDSCVLNSLWGDSRLCLGGSIGSANSNGGARLSVTHNHTA
jgi:hypothetical protein